MNVALTRAKSSLFVLGNASTLERSDQRWSVIVKDARERGLLVNVSAARSDDDDMQLTTQYDTTLFANAKPSINGVNGVAKRRQVSPEAESIIPKVGTIEPQASEVERKRKPSPPDGPPSKKPRPSDPDGRVSKKSSKTSSKNTSANGSAATSRRPSPEKQASPPPPPSEAPPPLPPHPSSGPPSGPSSGPSTGAGPAPPAGRLPPRPMPPKRPAGEDALFMKKKVSPASLTDNQTDS